jgi:hypothetical protein
VVVVVRSVPALTIWCFGTFPASATFGELAQYHQFMDHKLCLGIQYFD